MTAKEALLECVEQFSEAQAEGWLAAFNESPSSIPWQLRPVPPTWEEMLAMSPSERDRVFRRWPPETDMEEFSAWDAITVADGLHD